MINYKKYLILIVQVASRHLKTNNKKIIKYHKYNKSLIFTIYSVINAIYKLREIDIDVYFAKIIIYAKIVNN